MIKTTKMTKPKIRYKSEFSTKNFKDLKLKNHAEELEPLNIEDKELIKKTILFTKAISKSIQEK